MTSNQAQFAPVQGSVITYRACPGRLGDNLFTYLHAKWLSYRYDMPLHCCHRFFPYATEFMFYEKELDYDHVSHPNSEIQLTRFGPLPSKNGSIAYVVPYFPELYWEYSDKNLGNVHLFDVDWNDRTFRKMAKEMLAPRRAFDLELPPKDRISIAIHVREGGTFDRKDAPFEHPLKVPPLSYYISSLLNVLNMLKEKSIYCHVFTDANQPSSIVEKIKKHVSKEIKIEFNYRKGVNRDYLFVLEDFFSLFYYDVLIRPGSNFSMVPSYIHDYAIITEPEAFTIHEFPEKHVTIDKTSIMIDIERYSSIINNKSRQKNGINNDYF
jgi:hypothetical protein